MKKFLLNLYSNMIKHLNIGGTKFQTTIETLQPCRKLIEQLGNEHTFLDRDAETFSKMLKLLRGYPVIREFTSDKDVLYELFFWNHEMLEVEIPKNYKSVPLTVYTLDQAQTENYGKTHQLIQDVAVDHMLEHKFLPFENQYVKCVVVGAPINWKDCYWVPNELVDMARLKYKFVKYFCKDGDLKNFSFV